MILLLIIPANRSLFVAGCTEEEIMAELYLSTCVIVTA